MCSCSPRPVRPTSQSSYEGAGRKANTSDTGRCQDRAGAEGQTIVLWSAWAAQQPPFEARRTISGLALGGHLKTGHRWTLQNRPTERNQDKSIYTLQGGDRATFFREVATWRVYTGPHLGGRYGDAGMRPERRLSGRNDRAAQAALPASILARKR